MFERALFRREALSETIDSKTAFESYFQGESGFAHAHWAHDDASSNQETLDLLKTLKVSARCLPVEGDDEPGACIFTGKPARKRIVFAKAY
jgi:prolyl-tRNA synthetase